jgi:WXG100 family type VII secretion target
MGNSGSGYGLTGGVLNAAAKDMAQTQEDLQGDIATLRQKLSNLNSAWVGQGGTAFQGAITKWEGTVTRVMRAMDDFEAGLLGSDVTYEEVDAVQKQGYGKYESGLG